MAETNRRLANRILIGLGAGVIAGVITLALGAVFPAALGFMQRVATNVLDPFGQVFLRLLFFVVIPLVFASLASGIVQLGQLERLGPLAGRTFGLFALNMIVGVALGLAMMNVLQPGDHLSETARIRLLAEFGGAADRAIATQAAQPAITPGTLVEMFMPRNLFGAFVGNSRATLGDVLPLIVFAILVGAAGTRLGEEKRRRLQDGLDLVSEVMTGIVHFALRLAPYAVPAMIYSAIVKVGLDILVALAVFAAGCAGAMLLHLFGTMSVFLKLWTRRAPRVFFKDIETVLVTAFSTSSSNATLPASLHCAKNLGIAPSTAGFVLPLGATMNMSGTALYEGCVVLFAAQVFGVELGLAQQVALLLLSVLSAVAVAGIPGGSLPMIAGLLVSFGIPPEGIGIVIGIDRILDMTRTTTNVGCDLVTAAIVDESVRRGPEAAGQGPSG